MHLSQEDQEEVSHALTEDEEDEFFLSATWLEFKDYCYSLGDSFVSNPI